MDETNNMEESDNDSDDLYISSESNNSLDENMLSLIYFEDIINEYDYGIFSDNIYNLCYYNNKPNILYVNYLLPKNYIFKKRYIINNFKIGFFNLFYCNDMIKYYMYQSVKSKSYFVIIENGINSTWLIIENINEYFIIN